jgi:hypothetical protein
LPAFLKRPEKRKNGRRIAGVIELTDFASLTTLPNISPIELPANPIRKLIR